MNDTVYTLNEFLCIFNEIVWPSATFFIWMVSVMYAKKKGTRSLEIVLALFVFSLFTLHITYCFFQRRPIGVSIPLSVGLICGILFYFEGKKKRTITQEEPVDSSQKQKPGRSIDTRTITDFVIGKDIADKTAYIDHLKSAIEGRRGQKVLEECILPELGTNISADITFRAFDEAFPNVTDKAGFSRFKKKIPSKIILEKI